MSWLRSCGVSDRCRPRSISVGLPEVGQARRDTDSAPRASRLLGGRRPARRTASRRRGSPRSSRWRRPGVGSSAAPPASARSSAARAFATTSGSSADGAERRRSGYARSDRRSSVSDATGAKPTSSNSGRSSDRVNASKRGRVASVVRCRARYAEAARDLFEDAAGVLAAVAGGERQVVADAVAAGARPAPTRRRAATAVRARVRSVSTRGAIARQHALTG